MHKTDITVIGAGAVGLAVAGELSKRRKNIFVIERNPSFGQETSSRNSEVIHAGIYYPKGSLKARLCVEGRELLYDFCGRNGINHRKTGKLIVAADASETKDAEALLRRGLENGVSDLRYLSKDEVRRMEGHVAAEGAVYSPSTGIFDSHGFMKRLTLDIASRGGTIVYNTEFIRAARKADAFEVTVNDKKEGEFTFLTGCLINAAGLGSDRVSELAGVRDESYRLKYCKGDYFRVHGNKASMIRRLVYPVPGEKKGGLGVHATPDLGGGLRLGPDDEYIDSIRYDIDETKKKIFYESVRRFLPFISAGDLSPDTSGIRPKLQGEGEPFRDFIIKDEGPRGVPGFINLIGIESPGLTASLSIAKMVGDMLKRSYEI
ncbi:MAG: NAD(P)/FAD-dependent oxidoreductase [Candidatus Omnitrophota bacterium]